MARRDRSDDFREFRLRVRREGFGIVPSTDIAPSARSIGWMENVHDIEYDIQRVENMMNELSSLHKEHLLPQFSVDVNSDIVQQIEIKTAEITRGYQTAFTKIKKIGKGGSFSTDEEKMKKNIQSSLASRLQELSFQFKRDQREYLSSLRGSEGGEDGSDPFALDINQVETSLSSALVDDVNFSHSMAVQREEELRNLLKSIEELNAIFKDISILVIEQGTILDRIDYNIEQADHNMLKAEEHLVVTHERAKSSRTKQCMILLCICVLGMILIVFARVLLKFAL